MIEHLGIVLADTTIAQMRAWIADCGWRDLDNAATLTDREVVIGIAQHFDGGVPAFLAAGST